MGSKSEMTLQGSSTRRNRFPKVSPFCDSAAGLFKLFILVVSGLHLFKAHNSMQPSRVWMWLDPSEAPLQTEDVFEWHDILNECPTQTPVCLALCLYLFLWCLNQFLFTRKCAFLEQLIGCFIGHMLCSGPQKNSLCDGWSEKHYCRVSQHL